MASSLTGSWSWGRGYRYNDDDDDDGDDDDDDHHHHTSIIIIIIIIVVIRWGLKIPLDDSEDSIAKAILSTQNIFKMEFRRQWESHTCEVEGCTKFLVSDGGMKIQR